MAPATAGDESAGTSRAIAEMRKCGMLNVEPAPAADTYAFDIAPLPPSES
jgi:hypothetical protein